MFDLDPEGGGEWWEVLRGFTGRPCKEFQIEAMADLEPSRSLAGPGEAGGSVGSCRTRGRCCL